MALKLANYELATASPAQLAPPAPKGAMWIDLDEAARRSGLHVDHLGKMCRTKWALQGLAKQERPLGSTSKPKWFVRDDAAPELSRLAAVDREREDLSHLTDAQRRQISEREAILQAWDTATSIDVRRPLGLTEEMATQQFINTLAARNGKAISRRTLYYWRNARRDHGRIGLLDGRGGQQQASADKWGFYFERLEYWYLDQRKRSVEMSHELAVEECHKGGHLYPSSSRTGRRHVDALPPQTVILRREGPEAFVNLCEPYIERDYSALASNDIWNADHHRLDVMVRVGDGADGKPRYARPWLTAWQDIRSRKIVGFHLGLEDPNTDTILRALEMGVLTFGLPSRAMVDNGKDFDSISLQGITKLERRREVAAKLKGLKPGEVRRMVSTDIDITRLRGVLPLLGIDVHHVQPYHGQSKPIERFFRTLKDRFARNIETFCGGKPDERPEDLEDRLARGMAPTLAELQERFATWLAADYNGKHHFGDGVDGMLPDTAWETFLVTKRTATPEQVAFALMPRVGPVKVGQHGVRWQNYTFGSMSAEVAKHFGQNVFLAVPRQTTQWVLLVDAAGRLLCKAELNVKLAFDATAEDRREVIHRKRSASKFLKNQHKHVAAMVADPTTLLADAAARRQREASGLPTGDADPTPPSLQPLRTPFDDQLSQLAQLRPTAGHEHLHDQGGPQRFNVADEPAQDLRLTAADFNHDTDADGGGW